MTQWSLQQDQALRAVENWRRSNDKPFFYLAGYAGTGKTTLAKELAKSCSTKFGAFTGKAASVMRSMGCENASTIHSLIYQPANKSAEHLRKLESYLVSLRGKPEQSAHVVSEIAQTEDNIKRERENLRRPSFTLNLESDLKYVELLVIDECSMVDEQMGKDLLSFGTPILVLGDPAQLPPVYGAGYFTAQTPDIMLTDVHRQALDSPVLWLATKVRQGENLALGKYGDSAVVDKVKPQEVLDCDQVLVGRNATRKASNHRIRELRGLKVRSLFPLTGDRLVGLRNNHEIGLMNGAVYIAQQDANTGDGYVNLVVVPEEGGAPMYLSAHREHFLGRGDEIDHWDRRDAEELDYGYALTVHKSQGSQWKSVVFFDEWFADHRREHLYTGLTRAQEKVRVVRK
jgi:exodeoxyribonuclease-5